MSYVRRATKMATLTEKRPLASQPLWTLVLLGAFFPDVVEVMDMRLGD